MHSRLARSVLIIATVYVLVLANQNDLRLYIHPRYILFTVAMSTLGVAILLYASIRPGASSHTHLHRDKSILPLLFLMGFALILPARSLTSATVSQRAVDSGSVVTTTESVPITTLLAGSTRAIDLGGWSRLLQTNPDPDFYTNKPADVSGFIYDASLGDDTVWIARFVLTCCAVDAQPIGVPVHIPNWQDTYDQDEWIHVEGMFEPTDLDGQQQIILQPDTIEQITEPDDPYVS